MGVWANGALISSGVSECALHSTFDALPPTPSPLSDEDDLAAAARKKSAALAAATAAATVGGGGGSKAPRAVSFSRPAAIEAVREGLPITGMEQVG